MHVHHRAIPINCRLSTPAIVGTVVASVLVVFALQIVLLYFCCRRQLAALLSHRRQMREGKVKVGDVDLISTARRDPRSDTPVEDGDRLGDMSARYGTVRSFEDSYEGESTISPFRDDAADSPRSPPPSRFGPFDTPPSESELDPPIRPTLRPNSVSSTPEVSPSLSADAVSPSAPFGGGPSASSSRTFASLTKAQMAATNPDPSPSRRTPPARFPPLTAPLSGFRRHEDAGRLNEVEDLPPLYRPEWEAENRRENGQER